MKATEDELDTARRRDALALAELLLDVYKDKKQKDKLVDSEEVS